MNLDEETLKNIEDMRAKYEFLTFVIFKDDMIYGIVQNETPKILMIYEFGLIKTTEDKEQFLQFGDEWWWGSNHSVPINLFIGERFDAFDYILRGYPRKPIETMIGPTFSLADRYLRRVRKKRIEVVIPKEEPETT
jgi:hypothetical protein